MNQNKWMSVLENLLLPLADKLNNNRYLTALRDGFMVALPLIIFGSIFVVIANFPFLDRVLSEEAYAAYQNALGPASAATLSIMGLFVIIGIGYKLTEHYGLEGIYGGVVSLAAFLIMTPQVLENVTGVIPTSVLGAEGLFLGIFTSFIASELYRYLCEEKLGDQDAGGRARCGVPLLQRPDSHRADLVRLPDRPHLFQLHPL